MNWIRKNRKTLIASVAVLAVLAAAFWYGGAGPGMRGWKLGGETADPAPAESQTQEIMEKSAPQPAVKQETPKETIPVSVQEPEELPQPTAQEELVHQPAAEKTTEEEKPKEEKPKEEKPAEEVSLEGVQEQMAPPPEESPQPVQPEEPAQPEDLPQTKNPLPEEQTQPTCTISVSCATILNNLAWLSPGKEELVPADGWILLPMTVTFEPGESVFDVLQRVCRELMLHMEFENTPVYNSAYIEGIGNLYEFDCGEQSGWMYKVNGIFPNFGCSQYVLQDGDVVCWVYTCDLGADVGGSFSAGG